MSDLLAFGRTSQVARAQQQLAPVLALGRVAANLAQHGACAAAIHAHRLRAVINVAAYRAVDRAEELKPLATAIHGAAPAKIALACAALNMPLVHISTHCVFSGTGDYPWAPGDITLPTNAYGRSNWAGEEGIRASGCTHAILRTSWVFSAHGTNFVKTMRRLSDTCDQISVDNDQIGGPTPAGAIAAACLAIAGQRQDAPEKTGTYHFSGAPDASWCSFARSIFSLTARAGHSHQSLSHARRSPAERPP